MPIKKLHLQAFIIMNEMQKQVMTLFLLLCIMGKFAYEKSLKKNSSRITDPNRVASQILNLQRLVYRSDITCVDQLRMDRRTFHILCELVRTIGGLEDSKFIQVEEKVAMFVSVLAHHVKNRKLQFQFFRSGETVSKCFNQVLKAVLRLHAVLLKAPVPIPENSTDERWKWFKNCLGALDGTYIMMNVPEVDKPRYRSRKGDIATNVLGVCSPDMKFIYVLPGWEGSAADSRVLRDAVTRKNGLRVPIGHYYGYRVCRQAYAGAKGRLHLVTGAHAASA